jgi:hypothetical protein
MKRARWPRAPLFLAFILAPLIERYFFISMNIYGWSWTLQPVVLVLLIITALFLAGVFIRHFVKQLRHRKGNWAFRIQPKLNLESLFAIAVLGICALAFAFTLDWPEEAANMPQISMLLAMLCALIALMSAWFEPVRKSTVEAEDAHFDIETDFGDLTLQQILLRGAKFIMMLVGYGALAWCIGILPATPLYLLVYMLVQRISWKQAVPIAAGFSLFTWSVFGYLLDLPWPVPLFQLF